MMSEENHRDAGYYDGEGGADGRRCPDLIHLLARLLSVPVFCLNSFNILHVGFAGSNWFWHGARNGK